MLEKKKSECMVVLEENLVWFVSHGSDVVMNVIGNYNKIQRPWDIKT